MSQKLKQKNNYLIETDKIKLKSKVMLAPMAGITDLPYRQLIRNFSKNCLLTTEMISSEMLMQNRKDGDIILKNLENEFPLAYQLSGHKPQMMAKAAQILAKLDRKPTIIDINMGCPVRKVVGGGDGSALMKTPQLAADIVKALKDVIDIPISVKFRLGYSASEKNFLEFAQLMEKAGADFMTIHCRTRSQMYSGIADWSALAGIKNIIKVPVFANGDITTVEKAEECLKITGVDGIAIGRGTLGNPDLIYKIEHYLNTGEILQDVDNETKIKWAKTHLNEEITLRGEKNAIPFMRKFYPYYIKGIQNAAAIRGVLMSSTNCDEIHKILDSLL